MIVRSDWEQFFGSRSLRDIETVTRALLEFGQSSGAESFGAYYTPPEMAASLAVYTLAPLFESLIDNGVPSVLDPTCGDGSLLLAAREYLTLQYQRRYGDGDIDAVREWVELNCLCGYDIDQIAIDSAKKRLPLTRFECLDTMKIDTEEYGDWDVVLTNPPFLGGSKISGTLGTEYKKHLKKIHPHSDGKADLSSHFLLQACDLTRLGGHVGAICTNTISQGATRLTGLKKLVDDGCLIYAADRDARWPGSAKVTVSLVWIAVRRLVS